jgi:hypothetical protein
VTSQINASDRFRRQHEELMHMAGEIVSALDAKALAADATPMRRLVARFSGKLVVHAEMENGALYPRLIHSADEGVRKRATALFDDVKHIYASFERYAERWPSADAIAVDPTTFVRETREIMRTLGARMRRENEELYPMADAQL